jgi:hypothetical protein
VLWHVNECGKRKKSYGNKNFKTTIPSRGGDRSKTAVEGMITNDARCMPMSEIKPRIAMANAAFSEEKNLFQAKSELKFKEETS